jgi:hypothetical protein
MAGGMTFCGFSSLLSLNALISFDTLVSLGDISFVVANSRVDPREKQEEGDITIGKRITPS